MKAIVLSAIRYRDDSYMLNLYTRQAGYVTASVKVGKRSLVRAVYLEPLQLLDIEYVKKPSADVVHLRGCSLVAGCESLHIDPIKRLQVMLLAEVLNSILRNRDCDEAIFDFVVEALEEFEKVEHAENFAPVFLIRLAFVLGIAPNFGEYRRGLKLNLGDGTFSQSTSYADIKRTHSLYLLTKYGTSALYHLGANAQIRRQLIEDILHYFHHHSLLSADIVTLSFFG